MSNHNYGFRSQADRQRDEALSCRYGRIGIPAVAAAKTVEPHFKQPGDKPTAKAGWKLNPDLPSED